MGIKDKVSAEELAAKVKEAVGKANQDEELQGAGQDDLSRDKEGPRERQGCCQGRHRSLMARVGARGGVTAR